jgi:predicted MFS family arabinose efflux permease
MFPKALVLPPRPTKPRTSGLTMVIDHGLSLSLFGDVVASGAEYVDLVKFGWGTAVVTDRFAEKLDVLDRHGIDYFFGGTLFEKHILQGKFDDFRKLCELNVPIFMAVLFCVGAFFAPYAASQQTLLSAAVGDDERELGQVNALLQSATRLAVCVGPAAAGIAIASVGVVDTIFIDAASYLFSAILLAICLRRFPVEGATMVPSRFLVGLRTVLADPLQKRWAAGEAFGQGAWQAVFALIPVVTVVLYASDARLAGLLLAGFGLGALSGSVIVGQILRRVTATRLAVGARIGQALVFLLLLLFMLLMHPFPSWALAVQLAAGGALTGLANGPMIAVRIRRIPPPVRTDTLTVVAAISVTGGTIGYAALGPLAEGLGTSAAFGAIAASQAIAAAWFVAGAAVARGPR